MGIADIMICDITLSWPLTSKFNMVTWLFLKIDMQRSAYSDMTNNKRDTTWCPS